MPPQGRSISGLFALCKLEAPGDFAAGAAAPSPTDGAQTFCNPHLWRSRATGTWLRKLVQFGQTADVLLPLVNRRPPRVKSRSGYPSRRGVGRFEGLYPTYSLRNPAKSRPRLPRSGWNPPQVSTCDDYAAYVAPSPNWAKISGRLGIRERGPRRMPFLGKSFLVLPAGAGDDRPSCRHRLAGEPEHRPVWPCS